MATALFVTVGGSPQPIIKAINSLKPERVVFICSGGRSSSVIQVTGSGLPCQILKNGEVVERLPNIPTCCSLGDSFDADRDVLILEDMDDLDSCYKSIVKTIHNAKRKDYSILSDYTGGTKTMSVALGLASVDEDCQMYLTTGQRKDLIKVSSGEHTEDVNTSGIYVEKAIRQIKDLHLSRYDYSGAVLHLSELIRTRVMDNESKKRIRKLLKFNKSFEAWDRFNHQEAWDMMEDSMDDALIQPLALQLRRVIQSRKSIDKEYEKMTGMKGHGYELIEDLIFNAQRRAHQSRYDDAVGRIYRAVELMIQIYLKNNYQIETGNLDILKLPEVVRDKYEKLKIKGKDQIQIGLKMSYELLSDIDDNRLQPLYKTSANKIEDSLMIRNHSLFAHGFKSISKEDYNRVYNVAAKFLYDSIHAVSPYAGKWSYQQLPETFQI